jgi:hypothetical protein
LYSREYTATRIMALPSCQDIGGEEPDSWGFCPVDFYVPSYIDRETVNWDDTVHRHRVNEPPQELQRAGSVTMYPGDPKTGQRIAVEKPTYPIGPLAYYPFGFVAGCIWGDDGSWKIQYLDLSGVEKGVLRRDARFGYLEMPKDLTLRQAIDMDDYRYDLTDEEDRIAITALRRFHLPSGKPVEVEKGNS